MWTRKNCCVCRDNFAVHPNAKVFETRQMCLPCRRTWAKQNSTNIPFEEGVRNWLETLKAGD